MGNFRLEKWYLDVTDDHHQAFIGYAAHLKWKWIDLRYWGFTFLHSSGKIFRKNSFRSTAPPSLLQNRVEGTITHCVLGATEFCYRRNLLEDKML